jgi:hypothetical protein
MDFLKSGGSYKLRESSEVPANRFLHYGGEGKEMRIKQNISLLCLLIFMISVPATVLSDQLPAKLEQDIFPGITELTYAEEDFVFDTTVSIHVTFTALGPNLIELKFKVLGQRNGGDYIPSQEDRIQIDWIDWETQLYSGSPPSEPWGVILDTESGYTEK